MVIKPEVICLYLVGVFLLIVCCVFLKFLLRLGFRRLRYVLRGIAGRRFPRRPPYQECLICGGRMEKVQSFRKFERFVCTRCGVVNDFPLAGY